MGIHGRPCIPRSIHHGAWGFSITEALVAALILVMGSVIALNLFTVATELFNRGRRIDDDQAAINADLAELQRRNRRFTCVNGSCSLISDATTRDPNENEYTPDHPDVFPPGEDFNNKMLLFGQRCVQPVQAASLLLTEFKTSALDTLAPMNRDIERSIDIQAGANDSPQTPHAYSVTYSKNDQILRRVRMVPTVAAWCP